MAENTKIEWASHTFNPWIGCTKVAPGCQNCYAEELIATRFGKVRWGPKGTRVKTVASNWNKVLKWDRDAKCQYDHNGDGDCHIHRNGCPRPRVFCASLADVFEDWTDVIHDNIEKVLYRCPDCGTDQPSRVDCVECGGRLRETELSDLRHDLFKLIDATPHLDWMLLTKRPENILGMWPKKQHGAHHHRVECSCKECLYRHNAWLYTSVSDQETANRNIPRLLDCRGLVPVLGLSAEPLLDEVNLSAIPSHNGIPDTVLNPECWGDCDCGGDPGCFKNGGGGKLAGLDHVIVGGESGPNARPCQVDWVESIVAECQESDVPVFVKQLGANAVSLHPYTPSMNSKEAWLGRVQDAKGGNADEWPESLRVRELPLVRATSSKRENQPTGPTR